MRWLGLLALVVIAGAITAAAFAAAWGTIEVWRRHRFEPVAAACFALFLGVLACYLGGWAVHSWDQIGRIFVRLTR